MTVLSLAFFAAIVQNAEIQTPSYALLWKPEKGGKASYLLEVKTLSRDNPMEMEVSLEQSILRVSGEGYEAKTISKGAIVRIAGEEIRDSRESARVVKYTKRGAVSELKEGFDNAGDEPWLFALSRTFVAPESPVQVGGGWQYEYKANKDFQGARLSYTLKSVDKGVAMVDFHVNGLGRERPALGRGTWMVDIETGEPKSMTGHIKGLFGSGDAGADIALKLLHD